MKGTSFSRMFFLEIWFAYSNSKVVDVVVPSISTGDHKVISLLAQGGGEPGGQGGGQVDHDGCREVLEVSTSQESSTCSPVSKADTSL